MLEETDTGIWEWDLDTDEVRWDETSERLFGYDPGEFPNEFAGFAARVPGSDLQRVNQRVDHVIDTDDQYRAEFRVRPSGGDQRWFRARGVAKYDDDGEPEQLLGIQTDVTEHKQSEQALERARERLRQFIDLIPDPLYVKNRDDEVLLSNVANARLHGLNPEEMESMIGDLLALSRAGGEIDDLETVSLASVVEESWDNVRPDGTNTDGTGFGLSIVQEVVDAHGWTVSTRGGRDGGSRLEIRTTNSDTPGGRRSIHL